VFALAVLSVAPAAGAFCRTTTQPGPSASLGDCSQQGKPLFWRNACVGFSVQKTDGKQITSADLAANLAKAFESWTSVSCGAAGHPSIELKQLAPTTVSLVEYKPGGPNANLVIMRDDSWPHQGGAESLALTSLTFSAETGEIYDGDIEINTAQNKFAVADPIPDGAFDLRVVLAHQAGHFLGFGHSSDPNSPMRPTADPGKKGSAAPAPDDVAGICDTYAPGGARKTAAGAVNADACDPTPRGGLELVPTPAKASSTDGCAASPTTSTSWSGLVAFGLSALAVLARRGRGRPSGRPSRRH
jgi:hypothetical protein